MEFIPCQIVQPKKLRFWFIVFTKNFIEQFLNDDFTSKSTFFSQSKDFETKHVESNSWTNYMPK